jgi:hypothetical protein
MVPEAADHVTVLSETVPETVAENCEVPPVVTDIADGVMLTEFTTGAETVTLAVPDFVVSAALVAVIVSVPALAGAV